MPVMAGSFTGTGSSQDIQVGYKPKMVRLFNASDPALAFHTDSMPALSFFSQEDSATAYTTSQGVTLTNSGFTVGTDVQINADGDTIHWIAIG